MSNMEYIIERGGVNWLRPWLGEVEPHGKSACAFSHAAIPTPVLKANVRTLLRNVCLQCDLICCPEHPEGSRIVMDELARVSVEVLPREQRRKLARVLAPSLVQSFKGAAEDPCLVTLLATPLDEDAAASVQAQEHASGVIHRLKFDSFEEVLAWRAQHMAREAIVLHVPDVAWQRGSCRCCGSKRSSPDTVQGRSLNFSSEKQYEAWRQAHTLEGHKQELTFILAADLAWPEDCCRCCGGAFPNQVCRALQHELGMELHFASEAARDIWLQQHEEIKPLLGPASSCTWSFGPVECLPLLRSMRDYDEFMALDHILFTNRFVVPAGAGLTAREAALCFRSAAKIERLAHAMLGQRVLWARGKLLVKVGDFINENAPFLRNAQGALERYQGKAGLLLDLQQLDDDRVRLVIALPPISAELTQQRQVEFVASIAKRLLGAGGQIRSALEKTRLLAHKKKVCKASNGSLRSQAETAAHWFTEDEVSPRVVISVANARSMKVIRRLLGNRQDYLALLNGLREYPGAWGAMTKDSLIDLKHFDGSSCTGDVVAQLLRRFSDRFKTRVNSLEAAARLCEASGALDQLRVPGLRSGKAPLLLRELQLLQVERRCARLKVKYIIAHPVNEDHYYAIRNPVDNAGSISCVTLKIVPGDHKGAGFPAVLLKRFGMDYDGDHAAFLAVLDVASALAQMEHFGPEQRIFMEDGSLVGGPTSWPVRRWHSLLTGHATTLSRRTALQILAGAGRFADLIPPEANRAATHHRPNTTLMHVGRRQRMTVVSPAAAGPQRALEQQTCRALAHPLVVRLSDTTSLPHRPMPDPGLVVLERPQLCHLAPTSQDDRQRHMTIFQPGDAVAAATDPSRCIGTVEAAATWLGPLDPHIWVQGANGQRWLERPRDVCRADVRPADLLGALLGALLPEGFVLREERTGKEIWRAGQELWRGGSCSLHVPRRGGKGWETLVLGVLLRRRRPQRPHYVQDAWAQLALPLVTGHVPGCCYGFDPLRSNFHRPCSHRRRRCRCAQASSCASRGSSCRPELRWALLALRMRSALNDCTPLDFKELIGTVARQLGLKAAMALTCALQATGSRMVPPLEARAQQLPGDDAVALLRYAQKSLNAFWAAHPKPAALLEQTRQAQRSLMPAMQRIYELVARGAQLGPIEAALAALPAQLASHAPTPALSAQAFQALRALDIAHSPPGRMDDAELRLPEHVLLLQMERGARPLGEALDLLLASSFVGPDMPAIACACRTTALPSMRSQLELLTKGPDQDGQDALIAAMAAARRSPDEPQLFKACIQQLQQRLYGDTEQRVALLRRRAVALCRGGSEQSAVLLEVQRRTRGWLHARPGMCRSLLDLLIELQRLAPVLEQHQRNKSLRRWQPGPYASMQGPFPNYATDALVAQGEAALRPLLGPQTITSCSSKERLTPAQTVRLLRMQDGLLFDNEVLLRTALRPPAPTLKSCRTAELRALAAQRGVRKRLLPGLLKDLRLGLAKHCIRAEAALEACSSAGPFNFFEQLSRCHGRLSHLRCRNETDAPRPVPVPLLAPATTLPESSRHYRGGTFTVSLMGDPNEDAEVLALRRSMALADAADATKLATSLVPPLARTAVLSAKPDSPWGTEPIAIGDSCLIDAQLTAHEPCWQQLFQMQSIMEVMEPQALCTCPSPLGFRWIQVDSECLLTAFIRLCVGSCTSLHRQGSCAEVPCAQGHAALEPPERAPLRRTRGLTPL